MLVNHGEHVKNQIGEAKKLIIEEQYKALKTSDPREREEIMKRLREKIRKIVKCKRCLRVIS